MRIRIRDLTAAALISALPLAAAMADDAEYKSKTTIERDGGDYKAKTETKIDNGLGGETKRETKIERDGNEVKTEQKTETKNGGAVVVQPPAPPAPDTVIIERGISR